MTVKRIKAVADASITNAKKLDLIHSGALSNSGLADSLQIFSAHNEDGISDPTFMNGISRALLKFDVESIDQSVIPWDATFMLRMFNVVHDQTLPRDFKLVVHPVTRSWDEGRGIDLDNFSDSDAVNWISASVGTAWVITGSEFNNNIEFTQTFNKGHEDLLIDVTSLVHLWTSSLQNDGLVVKLTGTQEYSSQSFYKKMFSARSSEFFFSVPCLEARWDDSIFDDRTKCFVSSNLASAQDNLNTLIFQNRIRGRLTDIPEIGEGSIYVSIFTESDSSGASVGDFTGEWIATGTYKVQFHTLIETATMYDFWHNNLGTYFFSSSFSLTSFLDENAGYSDDEEFVVSIPNLKPEYRVTDRPKLNVKVRKRNWNPNVFTSVVTGTQTELVRNMFYRCKRVIDDLVVVDFGTGSVEYTKLSYDHNGNFFNFDMDYLEPGYQYQFDFLVKVDKKYVKQPEKFRFRVEE